MKKIKLIYFLAIFISALGIGQEKDQRGCTKHLVISAKMNFEDDLKNKSIVLYLKGGIVSVITKNDREFEKSYGIKYHDFGCVLPEDFTYYEIYNHYVFQYLTEKYGNDWKELMNKNAFGWKNHKT